MSGVRVLVGTRKGAFVLTSDGKRAQWEVAGPHFAGWEVYHLKGSPADPNRIYASQSSSWFGQVIQRSDDGGKTWEAVGNEFEYDGDPGHPPVVRRHAAPLGVQAGLAPRAVARPIRTRCTPASRTPRSSARATAGRAGRSSRACAPRLRRRLAAGRRRHVPAHDPARPDATRSGSTSRSPSAGAFRTDDAGDRPGRR